MSEVEAESIALMVTSPPYNVGMEYEEKVSWEEYLNFLYEVWKVAKDKLIPGGRFAINVANVGRNPYVPLSCHVTRQLLNLGMVPEGQIIWLKPSATGNGKCAWGSWRMPSNPVLEDHHEYILILRKDERRRKLSSITEKKKQLSRLSKEDFLKFRLSTWQINTANKNGHPCPFPVELPRRLIKLYTFVGDTVFDPFAGSGTSLVEAKELGRHYIGYEILDKYCQIAEARINKISH